MSNVDIKPFTLFLNIDFGKTLTGIEFSALMRAKLFIEYLDINPIIITARYNPHIQNNIDNLKKIKKAHKKLKFVNLYDVVQGFNKTIKSKPSNISFKNNLTAKQVDNYKDVKYYDSSDNLISYVVYDKNNNKLIHINYFNNKKIYKRDKYHYNGYLSSTQNIDTSTKRIINEVFYDISGKVVISKYYEYKNNVNTLFQIHIHSSDASIEHVFFNEQDFFSHALAIFIKTIKDINIFIISDKSKFLFNPAMHVKDIFTDKNISIVPVIHSTHTISNDIETGKIKSHYRDIFNNLNEIESINVFTNLQRDDIFNRFNYDKFSIIPHTYFKINKTIQYKPEKGKVVYIARFSPEKNHLSAVRIFKIVTQTLPDATLHFYGNGSEDEKIISLISELKLENNVFLHEYSNDIESLLSSAEVSILTSKMEGFNLSLLESIACSCPIIAYDIRYSPCEIISDTHNGFLIPEGNENVFADKIITILSNSDLQKQISKNAKSSFDNRFSPQSVATLWEAEINNIIKVNKLKGES